MKRCNTLVQLMVWLLLPLTYTICLSATIRLDVNGNILNQLVDAGIWQPSNPLLLHLGCGEQKFKGYVNIDYPPTNHTIQTTVAADVFAELTKLTFPHESVDEIRSHHVFEHFDRPTALALASKWFDWLKIGGTLIIETPDFEKSMNMLLNNAYSYTQKQSIMRHVFGSHEAHWAIHCDGWYKEKFEHVLTALGFENISFEFTQWQLTANIIVRAKKNRSINQELVSKAAKKILRESMVDQSASEEKMWTVWCSIYNNVIPQ